MSIFPAIAPTYGTTKQSQPAVRSARFGSGYEQRTQFGINQNPKVYSLTFKVSQTDSDTIETFLDARGAVESFDFTPPGELSVVKVVCRQWSKTIPYLNRAEISATFEQVFEP